MSTELPGQIRQCRREEYRGVAVQPLEAMTQEYGGIRCDHRVPPYKGLPDGVQWLSGLQAVPQ